MDDDGYGRWKRLDPDYEDKADSDIDVELPGYDESGAADIRTIIKSSQLRQCAKQDAMDDWTAQHDDALLHVIAIWASKSRQQYQTLTTALTTATRRITQSLTLPPLCTAASPHLPSLDTDWQYIAGLFEHFAAIHKSHTFLHARFAALTRMAFTIDGRGERGRGERVRLRERMLAVLGVEEEVEGREWLLHSGGRNWDEKRTVADRRRRQHRKQRKHAGAAAIDKKPVTVSTQHALPTAVAPLHVAEAQSRNEELNSGSVAEGEAVETVQESAVSAEAAVETSARGTEMEDGDEAAQMQLTGSETAAVR